MVFNRIEALETESIRARKEVGSVRKKLSGLLVEHGTLERLGLLEAAFSKSKSYWELEVDGLREVNRGYSRAIIRIRTAPMQKHEEDPSRGTIFVEVNSMGEHITYKLDRDNPFKSKSWIVNAAQGRIERGWESIAELDEDFFEWLEGKLADTSSK